MFYMRVRGPGTIPGILDHDMIVVDSTIKPVIQKKPPRKIFQYSKANWDKAKEDACTFNENFLASDWKDRSVDQNWTLFKDFVNGTISRNVPSKMSSKRTNVPWLTNQQEE